MKGDFRGHHGLKQVPDGLLPGWQLLLARVPPLLTACPHGTPQSTNKGPGSLGWQDTHTGNPLRNRVDFLKGGGGLSWGSLRAQGHPTLAKGPGPGPGSWAPSSLKEPPELPAWEEGQSRHTLPPEGLEGEEKCHQWSRQMARNSPDSQKTPVPGSLGSCAGPTASGPVLGGRGRCVSGEIYMERVLSVIWERMATKGESLGAAVRSGRGLSPLPRLAPSAPARCGPGGG